MDTFEIELPNGSGGDALLHLRWRSEPLSVLFDAGDPGRLAPRDVLRVAHLFVSHCHVDHFVGFDALVRPRVCRSESMTVHGPAGFIDRVASRLAGYTWNLVDGNHFVIEAREVDRDAVRRARFDSGRAFEREDLEPEPRTAVVFEDELFVATSAALDHHVVSQGWAVQGRPRARVRVEAVTDRGLEPGPWLSDLKAAATKEDDPRRPFRLPDDTERPIGDLVAEFLLVRAGEKVAFITDTACDASTRPRMVELAEGADVLACGAPFLSEDGARAAKTRHLTARQAGEVAAEAGVRELLLFHVSDRYGGDFSRHVEEARRAAGASVEVTVRDPLD